MNEEKKKEIIKELILKEEDVLKKFERLVKLASHFLNIEENTGRVMIKSELSLTYPERIFLVTLGKYFAYHYGIIEDYSITIQDIGEDIGGIQVTSFSKSLGKMVSDNIINKKQKAIYKINPHQIEKYLKEMHRKHFPENE